MAAWGWLLFCELEYFELLTTFYFFFYFLWSRGGWCGCCEGVCYPVTCDIFLISTIKEPLNGAQCLQGLQAVGDWEFNVPYYG